MSLSARLVFLTTIQWHQQRGSPHPDAHQKSLRLVHAAPLLPGLRSDLERLTGYPHTVFSLIGNELLGQAGLCHTLPSSTFCVALAADNAP